MFGGRNSSFFKTGLSLGSFSLLLSFLYYTNDILTDKFLPMMGFKPRISGVGSNGSANGDTTIAHYAKYLDISDEMRVKEKTH